MIDIKVYCIDRRQKFDGRIDRTEPNKLRNQSGSEIQLKEDHRISPLTGYPSTIDSRQASTARKKKDRSVAPIDRSTEEERKRNKTNRAAETKGFRGSELKKTRLVH